MEAKGTARTPATLAAGAGARRGDSGRAGGRVAAGAVRAAETGATGRDGGGVSMTSADCRPKSFLIVLNIGCIFDSPVTFRPHHRTAAAASGILPLDRGCLRDGDYLALPHDLLRLAANRAKSKQAGSVPSYPVSLLKHGKPSQVLLRHSNRRPKWLERAVLCPMTGRRVPFGRQILEPEKSGKNQRGKNSKKIMCAANAECDLLSMWPSGPELVPEGMNEPCM